ncbi:MAG: hypothetical protein JWL94_2285 [Microbacteriaceae bacterium]|nr:hypothetical protein [Microbacteriaceae bacterium]
MAGVGRSFFALASSFLLAHVVLAALNLLGNGYPLGDVTSVYLFWSDRAFTAGDWVGIDREWVYPIAAIVPMLAAGIAYPFLEGVPALAHLYDGSELYATTWLAIVTALDLVAFGVLTGWGRRHDRFAVGWWWTAYLLALGPIALGRIDAVTVPVAIVGVLLVASRPRLATVLLTVAAWIKVWPGAVVIAMAIMARNRWGVLGAAIATSAAIAAVAIGFGSGWNVLSFVSQQAGRGLQVEAPISTPWMWLASAGVPGADVYYDRDIFTWQVAGAGVDTVSSLMTPILLLAVAAIVALGIVTVRRGASARAALPPLVLALVTGMIAFQKVGSPQFISWLAVPVVLGLVTHRAGVGPSFRAPAALAFTIAALTHIIYPYLYGYLLGVYPAMLAVLTMRNALLFVLLGWAVIAIVRSSRWSSDSPRARMSEPRWRITRRPDRLEERASLLGLADRGHHARSVLGSSKRRAWIL